MNETSLVESRLGKLEQDNRHLKIALGVLLLLLVGMPYSWHDDATTDTRCDLGTRVSRSRWQRRFEGKNANRPYQLL